MANVVDLAYGPDGLLYQVALDTGFKLSTGQEFGVIGNAPATQPKHVIEPGGVGIPGRSGLLPGSSGTKVPGGGDGGGGESPYPQVPQSGAAGPFAGQGVFTAWDPSAALRMANPPSWVAIMPDKITQELVDALRAKGIRIVIWEAMASQAGADAVRKYGADGYIAQAEGESELAAANAIAAQIQVPKALVSNNFMPAYPPGWIAMPEAYTNNNPYATADQVTRDAKYRGATTVVPILGLFNPDAPGGTKMTYADYQKALALAIAEGAAGVGAYLAEQMVDGDGGTGGYTTPGEPAAGGPTGTPGNPAGGGGQPGQPGTGSHSGGSSGGDTAAGGNTIDWSQYFSDWGLPADVVAQLNQILQKETDTQRAVTMGIAFIRGTAWYKATYPGITSGFANGLVANEAQYRQMLNEQNQLFAQYLGRPITRDEFAAHLNEGIGTDTVSKRLQGQAYIGTYRPDIQFALGGYGSGQASEGDLTALGQQQAGLSNPVGMKLAKALDEATKRLQGLFGGTLASPAGLSLGGAGLAAQGVQGGSTTPDIGK